MDTDPNREAFDRAFAQGEERIAINLDGAQPRQDPGLFSPVARPDQAAKPAAPQVVEVEPEKPSSLAWIGRALKSAADGVVSAAQAVEFRTAGTISAKQANQAAQLQAMPPPPAAPWGWIAAILAGLALLLLLRRS